MSRSGSFLLLFGGIQVVSADIHADVHDETSDTDDLREFSAFFLLFC